jgi:hypothetical protein
MLAYFMNLHVTYLVWNEESNQAILTLRIKRVKWVTNNKHENSLLALDQLR